MKLKAIVIMFLLVISDCSFANESLSLNYQIIKFMFNFDKVHEEKNEYLRAELKESQSIYFNTDMVDEYTNTEFNDVFTNADYYILSDDLDSLKAIIKSYSDEQIQYLLSNAAYYGTPRTVDFLIKASKDINKPGDEFGGPPVLASNGRLKITNAFISNGANINATNAHCLGLLDFSIMDGDEAYIQSLLDEKIVFTEISSLVKEKIDYLISDKKLREYINTLKIREQKNCRTKRAGKVGGEGGPVKSL